MKKNKNEPKILDYKALQSHLVEEEKENRSIPVEAIPEDIPDDEKDYIEEIDTIIVGKQITTDKTDTNSEEKTIIITEEITTSSNPQEPQESLEEIAIESEVVQPTPSESDTPIEVEEQLEAESELLEQAILDGIEKIIQEDLYELEKIEYELQVLAKREEEEVLTDEIDKIREELEALLEKFELIRSRYEQFAENNDLLPFDDNYFYNLMAEYKDTVQNNQSTEEINDSIQHIEEYVGVIEKIIESEKKADILEGQLEEKKSDLEIRDEEFETLKEEYENIEKVVTEVDAFSKEQDKLLASIEEKIKYSEDIQSRIDTQISIVPDINKLLNATLMFAAVGKIPPTPRGYLMKTGLIIGALRNASQFLRTEQTQKKVTTIKYTNYAKEVISSINSIDDIVEKIENASIDIQYMRETFEKECSEYQGLIPEYDELIKSIDDAEKQIETNKNIILKYRDDFEKTLEVNNAKVKRLEDAKN